MNRSVPLTVLTIAAVSPPLAAPWIAVATGATTRAASTRLVYGPTVGMRWGDIQVKIRVKGKKITNIGATYPTERPKSARINNAAIPVLRREALRAQNAHINTVSGATLTSSAYARSLQGAISKAHV
jgi:uncharacterized protein with FMN-binding domain